MSRIAFNKFLDDVFARLKAGEITRDAADSEINAAIAKIVADHDRAPHDFEFREQVRKRANA